MPPPTPVTSAKKAAGDEGLARGARRPARRSRANTRDAGTCRARAGSARCGQRRGRRPSVLFLSGNGLPQSNAHPGHECGHAAYRVSACRYRHLPRRARRLRRCAGLHQPRRLLRLVHERQQHAAWASGLGATCPATRRWPAALVMSFVSGVILASVVTRWRRRRFRESLMLLVTALLVAAATLASLSPGPIVLILLAMAMGCENGIAPPRGRSDDRRHLHDRIAGQDGAEAGRRIDGRSRSLGLDALSVPVARLRCRRGDGAASHLRWGWTALWLAPIASAALTFALVRVRPKLSGPWVVR